MWARLEHDSFFLMLHKGPMQLMPPPLVSVPTPSFILFLSHHLFNSVPVKWTGVASPAQRSFLMRFCGLYVLILWCIVRSCPSIKGRFCYRQNQAEESWPKSQWTESKPRMDTTMCSTLALVHTLWRMNMQRSNNYCVVCMCFSMHIWAHILLL